jgi:hypothetical protein
MMAVTGAVRVDVAGNHGGQQALFCGFAFYENDTRRARICTGGSPFHQVIKLSQQVITDRLIQPRTVSACAAEDEIKTTVVQSHNVSPCVMARLFIQHGLRLSRPRAEEAALFFAGS